MSALLNGRAVRGTIQGDAGARTLGPHLIGLYRQGRFPVGRLNIMTNDDATTPPSRRVPGSTSRYLPHFRVDAGRHGLLRLPPDRPRSRRDHS